MTTLGKNLQPLDLQGVNPIVAMPFTQHGEVDYKSFTNLLEHLASTNCQGLTLFGIASEFYKLEEEEKKRLAGLFLGAMAGTGVYRCISVTDHATEVAVKRALEYQMLGADALMLLPPFFLQPNNEQVKEHICAVLEAVNIPVLVQYAPSETGTPIAPEQMAQIGGQFPHATFKIECNPPVEYTKELLSLKPDAVVLNGYAGLYMMDMLTAGGRGVMPGCSFTEIYVEIYRRWKRGDSDKATELHSALLKYIQLWMSNCEYIIQVEKTILFRKKIIRSPYCRAPGFPLTTLDEETIDTFLDRFKQFWAQSNPVERENKTGLFLVPP
jgi:2-keto-3-deoxy-L-arabinonate dehydratase